MPVFRPHRPTYEAGQRTIRDVMARCLDVLKIAVPDSFLGRKTQEPFPQEDNKHMVRWLISKELRPPE